MIISHSKKFIFLHAPKTAGSSVFCSLCRHLEPGDEFIDAISDAYTLGSLPTKTYIRSISSSDSFLYFLYQLLRRQGVGKSLGLTGKRYYKKIGLQSHSGWRSVKEYVGDDIWNSYYKFSFERNPYSRLVSLYKWDNNIKNQMTFNQFIFKINEIAATTRYNKAILTWDGYYAECNNLILDYVGKFEDIDNSMKKIHSDIGIPYDGWLPHTKKARPEKYQEWYTSETQKIVEKIYTNQLKTFEYKF